MSIFDPNESKEHADARRNAAINSPTSPFVDRTPFQTSHYSDQIDLPAPMAVPDEAEEDKNKALPVG